MARFAKGPLWREDQRTNEIVECFGLPGAGKTYAAKKVVEVLRARGVCVGGLGIKISEVRPPFRLIAKLSLIALGFWGVLSALPDIRRLLQLYKPMNSISRLRLLLNWLYLVALIRSRSTRGAILVLDQGIAQAIWSTQFWGLCTPPHQNVFALVDKLLTKLRVGRLSILDIKASDEKILQRIQARKDGRSPLDRDLESWQRAGAVTQATRKALASWSRRSESISIHELRNDGNSVYIEIRRIFEHRTPESDP